MSKLTQIVEKVINNTPTTEAYLISDSQYEKLQKKYSPLVKKIYTDYDTRLLWGRGKLLISIKRKP